MATSNTVHLQSENLSLDGPASTPGHILQLPDEVLVDIITAAAPWPEYLGGIDFYALYADRRAMTLVCCRFHRLATPLLYSHLLLTLGRVVDLDPIHDPRRTRAGPPAPESQSHHPLAKALRLLHRTLKSDPSLASLCRELVIDASEMHGDDRRENARLLRDLVDRLTNTERLRLHNAFQYVEGVNALALLEQLPEAMAARLSRLVLTARQRPFNLGSTVLDRRWQRAISRLPALRELHLAGLNQQLRLGEHVAPELIQAKAQFTELIVSDYTDELASFSLLCAWPARLEKFTCLGRSKGGWCPLDLRTVWSALVPHLLTLKSIRIGSVTSSTLDPPPSGSLTGVDFSFFGALTFLSLSYRATGPVGEAALLAPNLDTFEWVFDTDDRRMLFVNDFGQAEGDFLRRLAQAAVERKVPLRRIAIVFTPAPMIGTRPPFLLSESREMYGYTWDRIDKLAEDVGRLGIELTYNKPSVSRDEFAMAVRAYEVRRQMSNS